MRKARDRRLHALDGPGIGLLLLVDAVIVHGIGANYAVPAFHAYRHVVVDGGKADAGVVGVDDLLVGLTALGSVVDAGHAHAHPVSLAVAMEGDGTTAGNGLAGRQAGQGRQQGQADHRQQHRYEPPATFLLHHPLHAPIPCLN